MVTGDHARDRFVYVKEKGDEPANLREAWVDFNQGWLDVNQAEMVHKIPEFLAKVGLEIHRQFYR